MKQQRATRLRKETDFRSKVSSKGHANQIIYKMKLIIINKNLRKETHFRSKVGSKEHANQIIYKIYIMFQSKCMYSKGHISMIFAKM